MTWLCLTISGEKNDKVRLYFGSGGIHTYSAHKSGGSKLFGPGENISVTETPDQLDFLLGALSVETFHERKRQFDEFLGALVRSSGEDDDGDTH